MSYNQKIRCGERYYHVNENKYVIPLNARIFSSKSGKLCYLSAVKNSTTRGFKDKYIATVKFIEENRCEEVDYEIIKKFLWV